MTDLVRVFVLMIVVGTILYLMDAANVVVFQAALIGLFFVGSTHLTRRILFTKLDIQTIALTAVKENNLSASLVFMAVIGFLLGILLIPIMVLK